MDGTEELKITNVTIKIFGEPISCGFYIFSEKKSPERRTGKEEEQHAKKRVPSIGKVVCEEFRRQRTVDPDIKMRAKHVRSMQPDNTVSP